MEQNMKKYILIQNDGEIEQNSFELIGASTKRGEAGKVGFFGSGLKYSIAYMMRNDIAFRIFSGEKELIFTTENAELREQGFKRICINGNSTSYTTTMGPTWTEDWFVLREIYCNAIDESNCIMVKETENINAAAGKTRIYIELTEKLESVIAQWDSYFSIDREPLFKVEKAYSSFVGSKDIGASSKNEQTIEVYAKTEGTLYRKGIRVFTQQTWLFDYSLQFVNINEDRTAQDTSGMSYVFVNLMADFVNQNYVEQVLSSGKEKEPSSEYRDLKYNSIEKKFSDKWVQFSNEYLLVSEDVSGKFADEINTSKKEYFLIPTFFAKKMKKQLPEVKILGLGRALGDVGISDIEPTEKMKFLLKQTIASLTEMKYEVPFDITIVQFDTANVLGRADIDKKQIYMSDTVFDLGRREIAMTLMEETEHIKSRAEDESRAFQTHIFSQWLKTMEDANGLFL